MRVPLSRQSYSWVAVCVCKWILFHLIVHLPISIEVEVRNYWLLELPPMAIDYMRAVRNDNTATHTFYTVRDTGTL